MTSMTDGFDEFFNKLAMNRNTQRIFTEPRDSNLCHHYDISDDFKRVRKCNRPAVGKYDDSIPLCQRHLDYKQVWKVRGYREYEIS